MRFNRGHLIPHFHPYSNVKQQWQLLPSATRAQLAQTTWEALGTYIRRAPEGGLARLGADPAASQVCELVGGLRLVLFIGNVYLVSGGSMIHKPRLTLPHTI